MDKRPVPSSPGKENLSSKSKTVSHPMATTRALTPPLVPPESNLQPSNATVKRGMVEHDVGRVRSDELDTGANVGQPAVHWTLMDTVRAMSRVENHPSPTASPVS